MSQTYKYVLMEITIIILFWIMGLPTGLSVVMDYLNIGREAQNITLSTFWLIITGIFTVGVGAGIVTSFFTRTQSESFIAAPLAAAILWFTGITFVAIINYTRDFGYVYYITIGILVPLLIGFSIPIIKFWRGSD